MRHAIGFVLAALLAGTVMLAPASAQAPVKRVGYVVNGASGPRDHLEQALLDGLREQGYVEGRNLVVERRYVASLARPGGNDTGRSSQAADTLSKMFELFAAALPRATRIAVLYNTGNPVHPRLWRTLEHAGQDLGLSLMRVDVSSASAYPALFETMVRERLAALLVLLVLPDDNASFNARASLVDLAAKRLELL